MLPSVESWKQSAHNTQRYNSFCENQLVAPDAQPTWPTDEEVFRITPEAVPWLRT